MLRKIILSFFVLSVFLTSGAYLLYAQDATHTPTPTTTSSNDGNKAELEKKIAEYEKKLSEVRSEKNTLASQVEYMDTQIYITGLKIEDTQADIIETEQEINSLGSRIEGLDGSLNQLSESLLQRIIAGYKNREASILDVLFNSSNVTNLVHRVTYYQKAKESNEKILLQVQEAKSNFEEQKNLREKKVEQLDALQKTLTAQQADLASQQEAKKHLLSVTQNNEKNYQKLLEGARAEYNAIQGIISGAGTEKFVRSVAKGDTIASVIPGPSCNSSGAHLHFIVKVGNSTQNPFSYLKSVDHVNCSGSSCGSSDGDAFNPSGSWDWPVDPTIRMNQGYGETWAVRTYLSWAYRFHDGLDIEGSSSTVKSVADGELFYGGYSGFNGCTLPYVKVKHKDSDISTLYLHVYQN